MNKDNNEDLITILSMVLIVVAIIAANIVPIVGPSLATFAISYNKHESHWDTTHGLTDKKMLQSLISGEIIFLIIIVWCISPFFFLFNLYSLVPFLLSGLIINSACVVVFYNFGKKYYLRNLEKEAQQLS